MRKKMLLGAVLGVLALIVPVTGHAFTIIEACNAQTSTTVPADPCPQNFVCPVHTVNLRARPSFTFTGGVEITVSDTAGGFDPVVNTVTHFSDWITGRIQIDGPDWTTAQFDAFDTCSISVTFLPSLGVAPPAQGSILAIVEV